VFGDTELKYIARDKSANEKREPEIKGRESRTIAGWQVHVSRSLLEKDPASTAKALELLQKQLEEIERVVPKPAVAELKKVPLWVSAEYEKFSPRAEYHPDAGWLKSNHREAAMAKGVEFTNVRIFEAETRRMPNFALHELAHAYHDRVLSFDEPKIKEAYEAVKKAGIYEKVERVDSEGRKRIDKHYALSNHKEFFAEMTEAFFVRNDFFPFNRDELQRHDPQTAKLLEGIWKAEAK
jgi:dipeptidyl-peptidase-4